MYIVKGLWAYVTTIFHIHIGTLSSVQNAGIDQNPLPPPSPSPPPPPPAVVVDAASQAISEMPTVAAAVSAPLETYPSFSPPGSPPGDPFKCEYPQMVGWESCSTEYDRSCWLLNKVDGRRYDLFTNYENDAPTGITRYYNVNLTTSSYSADGWNFNAGKFFNNTYPGPWIEACWGDTWVPFLR